MTTAIIRNEHVNYPTKHRIQWQRSLCQSEIVRVAG